jgi:glyoxalase family protein
MAGLITGIHHVTALADDPQKNLDFYCGILGIRMVKRTINFDAPEVYHFYYGDEKGNPGSILTFFPYSGIIGGRRGKGMLNTTSFSVPTASMGYWVDRLTRFGIRFDQPKERFPGERAMFFQDHDGLGIEMVFNDKDKRPGCTYGHIPIEHAVRGFYHVEIWLDKPEPTVELLSRYLDHQIIAEKENYLRLAATDSPGNYVDLIAVPQEKRGLAGGGTVHHIALSTNNGETQVEVRTRLLEGGFNPTTIVDRQYFTSIYFREPGGVLFEVATEGPGFLIDESMEDLGGSLKLPPWYESRRSVIETAVAPIEFNMEKFR